ncbi:glycosyl hydrolase family 2, sugar binding domain protein [Rhodopirellula sallentina SM41]|uniref:beta-galactosidase n=2 Tax=Rhodopirellula TaxID=265488 RepID=M5U1I5_9BACT|nr:glycosyl hydrolase family 2, sugar binding domain protein [Rhodopirellula sallentina SM41]
MDPQEIGLDEKWFAIDLQDTITLPGSMSEQNKGFPVGYETKFTGTTWKEYEPGKSWVDDENYQPYLREDEFRYPFWLISGYHYVGAAWYQKEITVPDQWVGKPVELFLERPHWETRLWVNGVPIGKQSSLGVPHRYDIGASLKVGVNRITIRVDNSLADEIGVGVDAHSVSDNTQSNWNGIVGSIHLVRKASVSISNVAIFPDIKNKAIRLEIELQNATETVQHGTMKLSAGAIDAGTPEIEKVSVPFTAKPGTRTVVVDYPMGSDVRMWDEFQPKVYRMNIQLDAGPSRDEWAGSFGMREIRRVGKTIVINGRPSFFRGTLECCIFPKTGYPPTTVEPWERIINVCKSHGLNHIRFHSWCPPEAAFEAADRIGFYYQVEASAWATNLGDGEPVDEWVYAESERMVAEYGNHPSFCLLAYGNEPHGKKHQDYLTEFVLHWKAKDSRRLYTTAAGWPLITQNDYHNAHNIRIQAWNANLNGIINREPPQSGYDWEHLIAKKNAPVISHEIGQWCAYPNFKEIPKYDGVLKATNFKIFRDSLKSKGLLHLADDYLKASGKLQALCYKADIEAALRTKGFAGFQLLDLHDFPGQGTALVGVLDPFWDQKGYISPQEFRQFCNETVPLARFDKMIFTSDESVQCEVEVAHFGEHEIDSAVSTWKVINDQGKSIREGTFGQTELRWGNGQPVGTFTEKFSVEKATQFQLQVNVAGFQNSWDFWVYPRELPTVGEDVLVVSTLNEDALSTLQQGGKVLLTVKKGSIRNGKGGEVAVGFSSIFWNTAWTNGQKPHTLGILCDPAHPALAEFPTEFHSNWQWWDAMLHSNAISLEAFEYSPEPIVRIIDDWVTNRSLAMLFEAQVGSGRLVVSGVDLQTNLSSRPEAKQMLFSLKSYMSSEMFTPETELQVEEILSLFKTPVELAKSKAVIVADSNEVGYEAKNVFDGDPSTLWHTAWKTEAPSYPHSLQIQLATALTLKGFTLLHRQDGNRNGMIAEYEIYVSNDSAERGAIVAKGVCSADETLVTIDLDEPVTGRYITFVATSGFENDQYASIAEFDFIAE